MQKQAKKREREIEGILKLRKVAAYLSLFLGHNCAGKVFLGQYRVFNSMLLDLHLCANFFSCPCPLILNLHLQLVYHISVLHLKLMN